MNVKQFIKVTPKGGGRSVVLLANNRTFYQNQGATIETPTEDEVTAAFPEYAARVKKQSADANANNTNDEVERLKAEIAEKDAKIAELESRIAELTAEPQSADANDDVESEEAPAKKSGRKRAN